MPRATSMMVFDSGGQNTILVGTSFSFRDGMAALRATAWGAMLRRRLQSTYSSRSRVVSGMWRSAMRESAARSVELEGDAGVVLEQGLGVDVGEVKHAHIGVGLLDAGAPEADVLHRRHDAGEQARAELAHLVGRERRLDALLDGQSYPLPHLALVEPVAHVVTSLHHELLPLVALRLAELRVVVAQRETAEGYVARLVLHDVGVDGGGERVLRGVADPLERRQRQSLDEDLHAEVGHVPSAVADGLLEESAQAGRDRVGDLELLVEQAGVGLDMARLVHHLGRRVELGVGIGHGLHDLGGGDERALLAVHELRERLRLQMMPHPRALLVGEPLPDRGAPDLHGTVVHHHRVLGIEILRPVDAGVRVPLLLLALVVQIQELLAAVLVFPGEGGLRPSFELPLGLLDGNLVAVRRGHGVEEPPLSSIPTQYAASGKGVNRRVLRQFASPYFVARSPGMLNVQEVRLESLASSRLVWLATCHSTRLTYYQPPPERNCIHVRCCRSTQRTRLVTARRDGCISRESDGVSLPRTGDRASIPRRHDAMAV